MARKKPGACRQEQEMFPNGQKENWSVKKKMVFFC